VGRLWRRLTGTWTAQGRQRAHASLRRRFTNFLTICAANDRFLGRLARLMDLSEGAGPLNMEAVQSGYCGLCQDVEAMVCSLLDLSGGDYEELPARLLELRDEAAPMADGARPSLPPRPPPSLRLYPGEAGLERAEVVGSKAVNLARVAGMEGISVPGFYAMTAHAFRTFMASAGTQRLIRSLLETPDQRIRRAQCAELRRAILRAPMPPEIAGVLLDGYRALQAARLTSFGVAVRSSAVGEDSLRSFAGQFETVLGVREGGLVEAYKRVIASKYDLAALRYARLAGFLDEQLAMPVVVMGMVQAVASGVAYSRDPHGGETMVVAVVPGLAQALVDGTTTPDQYFVGRAAPRAIVARRLAPKPRMLRCSERGGLLEVPLLPRGVLEPCVPDARVLEVAELALRLEAQFAAPQDVEWCIDAQGTLFVVQSRPLRATQAVPTLTFTVGGVAPPVLLAGGSRACGGVASGRVLRLRSTEPSEAPAPGLVLVIPATSPRLSAEIEHAAAVVAEAGSATGHLATIARELQVPMVVGLEQAMSVLQDGMLVTVDAWAGTVYRGEPDSLPASASSRAPSEATEAAHLALRRLLERQAPLTLTDPSAPEFSVENCRTLHDIARFVHQKAMAVMFALDPASACDRRQARRLQWEVPIDLRVVDLGGGLVERAPGEVDALHVTSRPLRALIEGMLDRNLRWSGPVGFDLRGFMSVVVRSVADDQRYGEPSYAVCSRDYVHFSSRLAYHFTTVDAMCSGSLNQNYARLVFFGGAAVAERREWRAHYLATVLRHYGFEVSLVGDRIEATLGKREAAAIEEKLGMVARLLVSARHLDMVMDSQATAETYAAAFLAGDVGFSFVRRGIV
jgi:pyruvate, water dikinase